MAAGILGYGVYIPRYRLKVDEIEKAWTDKEYSTRSRRLGIGEKAVPGSDEDVVTMAYEAAQNALKNSGLHADDLGGLITGSMSRSYVDRSISASIAQMLGISDVFTCDCVSSSKSGTAALLLAKTLAESTTKPVLSIASDAPRMEPCSDLEPLAGAGAAAFILSNEGDCIAMIEGTYSCSREVYDIWHPVDIPYPEYDLALSGDLFAEVSAASAMKYLDMHGKQPADYTYMVFNQPNARAPLGVARAIKAGKEQVAPGLISPQIGDLFSASALVGLAAVLDKANPGEKALIVSYGSGGSDAFGVEVRKRSETSGCSTIEDYLKNTVSIDYVTYLKHMHII